MTSIVSTKNVEYHKWLTETLTNLEADSENIGKMMLISVTNDGEVIIDYHNCSTTDFALTAGALLKESIKLEVMEDLDLEDDYDGEYDTEDEI